MMLEAIKTLKTSLRALAVITALTGVLYPLLVTCLAQSVFPRQAQGRLLKRDGVVVGSDLLAQKFSSPAYFHARPSAADYATIPSGASNLSQTSIALKTAVSERQASLEPNAPADLLTASGSGLDPHISSEAARFQLHRVADARALSAEEAMHLEELVLQFTEKPQFLFLGKERLNVLRLNLRLDQDFPKKAL